MAADPATLDLGRVVTLATPLRTWDAVGTFDSWEAFDAWLRANPDWQPTAETAGRLPAGV